MKNNKQNYNIFADVLSDEVRYLCRRGRWQFIATCTVAADANGFYEKDDNGCFGDRSSHIYSLQPLIGQ